MGKPRFLRAVALAASLLCGCAAVPPSGPEGPQSPSPSPSATAEYRKITRAEADEMMGDDVVILDVRTREEYDAGHIEGAILLPDYEVADKVETLLTDREQVILVYCRTGRRSALAAQEMVDLGYTNVYDFGGILDS